MEKFNHIVSFYQQLPTEYQQETIEHLKELKALVYEEIEVPELEGDLNIHIQKVLLYFDYILGDELIAHDSRNYKRLIKLKEHIIEYVTKDMSDIYSYGSILTFGHYLNYILFVVINFEHYIIEHEEESVA